MITVPDSVITMARSGRAIAVLLAEIISADRVGLALERATRLTRVALVVLAIDL